MSSVNEANERPCRILLVLAIVIGMSTQPPAPTAPPAPSPDPLRWAAEEQPPPVQTNHPRPSRRWKATAHVGQWRTGNAAGVLDKWHSQPIFGSSADEVVMAQQKFLNEHLHPRKRQKKAKAPAAASSTSAAASSSDQQTTAADEPRARRSAAPVSLAESKGPQVAIRPRAGPGELLQPLLNLSRTVLGRPWAVSPRISAYTRVCSAPATSRMQKPGADPRL